MRVKKPRLLRGNFTLFPYISLGDDSLTAKAVEIRESWTWILMTYPPRRILVGKKYYPANHSTVMDENLAPSDWQSQGIRKKEDAGERSARSVDVRGNQPFGRVTSTVAMGEKRREKKIFSVLGELDWSRVKCGEGSVGYQNSGWGKGLVLPRSMKPKG